MDSQPLVSIGIPTYNRPEGLKRTLECITKQSYKNLEIIVSDNCSLNPEVEKVVKEFKGKDSRIQYFHQSENIGAANNFKFVLEKATGEYFMWATDDDEWDYEYVEFCCLNIGGHASIMTGFIIRNRIKKTDTQIKIPFLNNNLSVFNNVTYFLHDLRSSLFYGLHKRSTIGYFLRDDFFDYYDCYFVIKQIVTGGFVTYPSVYFYYAGLDSEEYVVKPYHKKHGKFLEYHPFFFKTAKLIIKTKKLGLKQRIKLIYELIKIIFSQFCIHEVKYRPSQVKILKYIANIFKRILKISHKLILRKNKRKYNSLNNNLFGKISYSQCGEDLIVNYIFSLRGIPRPTYLDIGANDPFFISNTALFYNMGCRGINIEANPVLFEKFEKLRPEDINLNIGIGAQESKLDFYIINDPTLSSFSKEECEKFISTGKYHITNTLKIKISTIQNILDEFTKGFFPDFLSIDVEGMDLEILKTIDYKTNAPKVICVEAADYSPIGAGERRSELIDFLAQNGYYEYANTNLNAIMVKRDFWFI
jgi:FkbM family methyltransferase